MVISFGIKNNEDINREKYNEIIQNCIKFWCDKDGKITKTKLAKLCYLADFSWFYYHLEPMTGLAYIKLPQWPVPEAYFRAVDSLQCLGKINETQKGQAKLISNIEEPECHELTHEELDLIQKICTKWQDKKTEEIVSFTHVQMPRKICNDMEIIPYEFITQEDPDHVY